VTSTVRDATLEVLRDEGLTTIFSNPGSTEVPFLANLPADIRFVLGLHEGSVVGIATGHALATGHPSLVLLHTTAGLGNAVGAVATARVNRAPLVIIVGQQDRRHLALQPFLAGRLAGLAGDYPLDVLAPMRAQDVPSSVRRASHTASQGRGPVLVIVPMDDWDELVDAAATAAPVRSVRGHRSAPREIATLAAELAASRAPAIVAGSGNTSGEGWDGLVAVAERLGAPVWQEPFGARAGFPQDHALFSGHLPADRSRLRAALAPHDVVLVVGAGAFRQYPFSAGTLVYDNTRLFVITDDPDEANRSPAELSLVTEPAIALVALRDALGPAATGTPGSAAFPPRKPEPTPARESRDSAYRLDDPVAGEPLRAAHVFQRLATLLPADTILLEESPSSRPALQALLPAKHPLGFLSAAMGGLGFAMPAAIGVAMALPDRPVVAIVGDGSSLYAIQSLWTAAHYGVGVVLVVLNNGGYAVMDRLADHRGGSSPWPALDGLSVAALAAAFGVTSRTVTDSAALAEVLDAEIPAAASRLTPVLIEIVVQPDDTFAP
jgi:benzoylformate decarboxylase